MSMKLGTVALRALKALARIAEESADMGAWGPCCWPPLGIVHPDSRRPARGR